MLRRYHWAVTKKTSERSSLLHRKSTDRNTVKYVVRIRICTKGCEFENIFCSIDALIKKKNENQSKNSSGRTRQWSVKEAVILTCVHLYTRVVQSKSLIGRSISIYSERIFNYMPIHYIIRHVQDSRSWFWFVEGLDRTRNEVYRFTCPAVPCPLSPIGWRKCITFTRHDSAPTQNM